MWKTRFDGHPLWAVLDKARTAINQVDLPEASQADRDALAYVGLVVELLEKRRTDTDGREVSPSMLNTTHNATDSLRQALEYLVAGQYTISNVLPTADAVVDSLGAWPPMKLGNYMAGIHAASESFERKAGEALERVAARAAAIASDLEVRGSEQDELRQAIETERQRIIEAIASFKSESAQASADFFEEQTQRVDEALQKWREARDADQQAAQQILAELRQHEDAARNVVHETTGLVVATDYGAYARRKTRAAWACDVAAALVGAAGVAAIIYHLFAIDPTADSNIGLSLTRLAASLGTLGIAALVARRGAQHHREARAAKRTDLGIRAVGPFTANLDPEDRKTIVRQFTERVFIRGDLDSVADELGPTKKLADVARRSRTGARAADDS